jgi:hypothetical protein
MSGTSAVIPVHVREKKHVRMDSLEDVSDVLLVDLCSAGKTRLKQDGRGGLQKKDGRPRESANV